MLAFYFIDKHRPIVPRSPLHPKSLFKYGSASVLNTAIGIAVIAFAYKITRAPYVTILISATFGYIYSLVSYHYIAFSGASKRIPYRRYAATYLSSLLLNSAATALLLPAINNFLFVQMIVVPCVVLFQWATSNFWVFKVDR